MMSFAFAAVLALAIPVFPYTVTYTMTYDTVYDHGANSLNIVTCSNGEHGLITAGYTTFESLPSFPYIGGAPQIRSQDSRYCGTCWQLTYTDSKGKSTSVNITAIDAGDRYQDGFILSEEAMNFLTDNQARKLSEAPITAVRVPKDGCGM